MISIDFFAAQGALTGFSARGHADTAPYGEDIVCAAVSSACLLTANTITEVLHLPAAAEMKDGFLQLRLSGDTAPAQVLLQGLKAPFERPFRAVPAKYSSFDFGGVSHAQVRYSAFCT